jgi:hypothetical protein
MTSLLDMMIRPSSAQPELLHGAEVPRASLS